ncbi:MAG: looped-hinge helix DNA binding domain, AbrB family [Haloquadratum walsbyi J07HQW1]|jgi:looped-hinge helix DNA binding domain, AbrB family|uniref:Looped-hinge helix DNA binding domain, AbrB family n=1 Tax=Haloquadratum walsbyi J07HQW1 TaxID=1238424 RepID=U1PD42_9EURY|nr:MAG: looped-hinge helix DNA binding domain, AbrB family [Haloquadratum walsbyi J07HQW1]
MISVSISKSTRVTDKGQVTIPEDLRKEYDREPGDEVIWIDTEEGIVIKKRTRNRGRGIVFSSDTPQKAREEVADELIERARDRRDRNYEK